LAQIDGSVQHVLDKVGAASVPEPGRVALAFSGGLDSSLCVVLLREKYRAREVVPIHVDVGQGSDELAATRTKAAILGIEPIIIDAREEFADQWLRRAVMANSDYLGYPVATSMTRQLIARKVAEEALSLECDALAEGSSGKGNDQYRMHNVFTLFAPGLPIIVPVRDLDLTRDEERLLCEHYGVPVDEPLPGGDDKTLWCRSIASGGLGLESEVPEAVWRWYVPPARAHDEAVTVSVTFERGVPTTLDGRPLPLADLIEEMNVLAGACGIGKIDILEDGIMGLKSREVYEAPGATVILRAHRDLEQLCLTKEEIQFKRDVDANWAALVYHGEWFHPLKDDLDAFIERSQDAVNGTVTLRLYKGSIEVVGRSSPTSLFFPELRSIRTGGFDQRLCGPAAVIRGLPFQTLAMREARPRAQAVGEGVPTARGN
jgi:argininosuccinate synthase